MKVQFLFNVENERIQERCARGVLFNKQFFSTPTNSVRMRKKMAFLQSVFHFIIDMIM